MIPKFERAHPVSFYSEQVQVYVLGNEHKQAYSYLDQHYQHIPTYIIISRKFY